MAIQPTVRTPVLERTSGESRLRHRVDHKDGRIAYIGLGSRSPWRKHTWTTRENKREFPGRGIRWMRTVKHLLSPVEDCLAKRWLAEPYEAARRAVRARRGANHMEGE